MRLLQATEKSLKRLILCGLYSWRAKFGEKRSWPLLSLHGFDSLGQVALDG